MFNPKNYFLERTACTSSQCKFLYFKKPISKIGRSTSMDISLATNLAKTVSREHSIIQFIDGKMYINNLSTTNPTFLNNDTVIRRTQVEEGDLIGFGSKPNCNYQHFTANEIFIYVCKRHVITDAPVLISDSSDDDCKIIKSSEAFKDPANKISSTNDISLRPNDTVASRNEAAKNIYEFNEDYESYDESPKHKIKRAVVNLKKLTPQDVEKWIRRAKQPEIREQSKVNSEPLNINPKSSDQVKTKSKSKKKISPIVDTDSEEDEDFKTVPISNTKARKSKVDKIAQKNVLEKNEAIKTSKRQRDEPQTRLGLKKVKVDGPKNVDVAEPKEIKKSACSGSNEPKKIKNLNTFETKADKNMEVTRRSIGNKTVAKNDSRNETKPITVKNHEHKEPLRLENEKTDNLRLKIGDSDVASKFKMSKTDGFLEKTVKIKFPGFTPTFLKSNNNNSTINTIPPFKSRRASSDPKNKILSPKSSSKFVESQKKRRMSLGVSSIFMASPQHSINRVTKKPMLSRRQTICESRHRDSNNKCREFDMFSKASLLRKEKFGIEDKAKGQEGHNKIQKVLPFTKVTADGKNLGRKVHGNDQNDYSALSLQDSKNVDQDIKSVNDHNAKNIEAHSLKSDESHSHKAGSSHDTITLASTATSKLDQPKKITTVKVKMTEKTRSHCLIVDIPKAMPIRRMSSYVEPQPSTSMSVSEFREKYLKTSEISSKLAPQISDSSFESLNERINQEMSMKHVQLAEQSKNDANLLPDCEHVYSPSSNDTDDDERNLIIEEPIKFYTETNETPPLEILESIPAVLNSSPMKDDPRGKTKWIGKELQKQNETRCEIELEPFPHTTLMRSIEVYHEIQPENVKKILKTSLSFSRKERSKKKVSFNDHCLVEVRFISSDEPPTSFSQQIAHVQPMRQSKEYPKNHESLICSEILEWDTKWLMDQDSIPSSWKLEEIKCTYRNLDEYKQAIRTVMNVQLLRKLSTKFKSIISKKSPWNFLTVKERKDEPNNHLKLVLASEQMDLKQGTLLLLKVRYFSETTHQQVDLCQFGYITATNDRSDIKLDTYGRDLPREMAVIKSKTIMFLQNDLKLFSVLNCIQESPLMNLFLNPQLNKIDRKEGILSRILDAMNLNPEQRVNVKKLSYDCMSDAEKILFVNGSAGTGKTHLMIATILNVISQIVDKRKFLICTSTRTGIDEISKFISELPCFEHLKIVRIGSPEKVHGMSKKFNIQEQILQRLNKDQNGNFNEIYKDIIDNANIVLSTCKNCYELFNYDVSFDVCFVDEANYCTDAELYIPIHINIKKLVLVGDEYQLTPTQSPNHKDLNANFSYFNRMIKYFKEADDAPVYTLTIQKRIVNRELFEIYNKYIYNNLLKVNPDHSNSNDPFKPFMIFGLNMPNDSKSHDDPMTLFCLKLCDALPKSVSIGIVNGLSFNGDRSKNTYTDSVDNRIEFISVDTAQGIEKDVIIITVRNSEGNYINNFNRINVAMTRARKALYICLNMNAYYPKAGLLKRLTEDARSNGQYHVMSRNDKEKLGRVIKRF